MRVLVTGHRGYIGSILAPMVQNAGHDVVGMDTGWFANGNLGPKSCGARSDKQFGVPSDWPLNHEPPNGMSIPEMGRQMDVRDVTLSDLRGFDAIIHLAGISNDPVGDLNPDSTYQINFWASVRLATLAKEAGVRRFLFASSCSLYGSASKLDTLTEEAPFNPVSPYGLSKMMVEREVSKLADENFSPTYLRCATAYGVSPRLRADLVVNNLVGHAYTRGEVLMKSDGTAWRPLVHIEDIARAYLAILHARRDLVHNQAFNVGRSRENYQIRQIAAMVQEAIPESTLRLAGQAGPDVRCYMVDCSKLERTLPEYQPRWTARRGIEELYDAYREFRLSEEDFLGPSFVRIEQIKVYQGEGRLTANLRWRRPLGRQRPRV